MCGLRGITYLDTLFKSHFIFVFTKKKYFEGDFLKRKIENLGTLELEIIGYNLLERTLILIHRLIHTCENPFLILGTVGYIFKIFTKLRNFMTKF